MADSPFNVVMASANRRRLLSRTLRSLSACDKPSSYRATIVVENGRKGETETVVNQFAQDLSTRYRYRPEGNKSKALNHALQTLDEGLIFFTDDDVRLHPDTLVAYARAAKGRRDGCFYGGPTGVDYEEAPPEWLREYLPPSAKGLTYSVDDVGSDDFCFFLGFNWAAFATDLRAAGGFNPNFGPGSPTGSRGQETEMQRRLWESGVQRIHVPQAMVWHYVPKTRCSPRWALRRAYQHGLERGLGGEPQVIDFLGFPKWMVRQWLDRFVHAARVTVSGATRDRFAAYYDLCDYTGFVRGVTHVTRAANGVD